MQFYRTISGALLILLNIINLPHKRFRKRLKKRLYPQTALTLILLLGGLSYTAADTLNIPLTFDAWQHYTLSSQEHQGDWEHSADGLKLYGSASGNGNGLMSKDHFDFRGTETVIKWQVNSLDQYSALLPHLKSLTGNALLSERFTTHHTEPGATLISDKTWYYTKITVNRDSTYTAITAQDDYDINGGFVIHSQFGTFNGAQAGYVAIYLADNDAGQSASLTLGEVKIKQDAIFSSDKPIDFNPVQRLGSARQGTRQGPINFKYEIKLSWNDYQAVDDPNEATTTTPEAETNNIPYSGSISDSHEEQILETVPKPTSQFEGGTVKEVNCDATTDEPKVAIECKPSGDGFVVSAHSKVPVAYFSNSHRYDEIVEQTVITLDGTGSSDDKNSSSLSYKWTASDGQTKSGSNTDWKFNVGEHEICLVVTDSDNLQSDSYCETLTVAACTYTITPSDSSIELDSSNRGDTGKLTVTTHNNCRWKAHVGYGEDWLSLDDEGPYSGTKSINYSSVADNAASGGRCGNITITNLMTATPLPAKIICQPGNKEPIADFIVNWQSDNRHAPVTVSLDASSSKDADGHLEGYHWTFSNEIDNLSGKKTEKTFQDKGLKTITLRVTDNDGATHTISKNIKVEPPFYTLNINQIGAGQGTVTQAPSPGPNGYLEGSAITLTANPALGSIFVGWINACPGKSTTCPITMDRNKTVTAEFELCSYTLDSSTNRTHPAKGDKEGFVTISTSEGCPWTAQIPNHETWLTIDLNSGQGNGRVNYTVKAHPETSSERSAILNMTGEDFSENLTVKQKANQIPKGDFTVNPEQGGNTPLTVTLNASRSNDPDGEITEYKWTEGGKTLYEGEEPKQDITLIESGNHTLSLVVTDDMGTPSSAVEKTVFVNTPPIADFTFSPKNKKGKVPLIVTLDASISSDEDGHQLDYQWKSDYSGKKGPTKSGVKTTMTLEEAEPYSIELIVTDELGAKDSKTVTGFFVDQNPKPEADFTVSPGLKGKASFTVFDLDASSSTDDELDTLKYQWNIDGQTYSGIKLEAITFDQAGIYSVELTVTDNKGLTHTKRENIEVVENQAPVAFFKLEQKITDEGTFEVSLDASESSDPDSMIKQYKWSSTAGHEETTSNPKITWHFDSGSEDKITHTITLVVEDEEGKTDSDEEQIELIKPGKMGQAIIVVATEAKARDAVLFSNSNRLAGQMYQLLELRGFTHEDIHYMNPHPPDPDDDGYLNEDLQDYKLKEPEQELTEAFNQAASRLKPKQQFVFYLHGHAEADSFQIKDDYSLEAQKFRALLDKIPADVQQVIILDTCYSGSFVDDLQGGKNRIVVTSTDDKTPSWVADNAGFSGYLFPELQRAQNFHDAFDRATDQLKRLGKEFTKQRPWLDADSDGQVNSSADDTLAAKLYLGSKSSSLSRLPEIAVIHEPLSLDGTNATETLWVQITSHQPKDIKKVRAVLFKPDLQANEYKGKGTNFDNRIELALDYNESQERYEVVYDYFCHSGIWKVMYQAQSKREFWSEVKFAEVEQLQDICLSLEMGLNKARYTTGDTFRLNMTGDGKGKTDVYVLFILPENRIFFYQYSSGFSNEVVPYYSGAPIDGKYVHPVLDIKLPADLPSGDAFACGVLVPAKANILELDINSWIDWHCSPFELY
jgi:stress response protein SCP2